MSIFVYRQLVLVFIVLMAISAADQVSAGSSTATSGNSAQVNLRFRVEIPPSLALQVKTATDDSMPVSQPDIEDSHPAQPNVNTNRIYVTASANVTTLGVLNASSDLFSNENSPTSLKSAGRGPNESFPLPYKTTGRYRVEYPPIDLASALFPYDSPTFILCSP